MISITNLIIGLIAVVVGITMLKYNYQLVGITGNQQWIESKLGAGSTYFAYKILALVIATGGLLYATGLGDPFLTWLFSPLRDIFAPIGDN